MDKLKIKRKITSSTITIKELDKFMGKEVDIIIKEGEQKRNIRKTVNLPKNMSGALEGYKNRNLINDEINAWERAVKEKHGNS